ncbi:MAG TPA: hypothetical protein VF753_13295 [Terriglobales bacterium]
MKSSGRVFQGIVFASIVLAACSTIAFAQLQAAPTGQNAGVCGGQQFCYETNDFVATVTDFRTSSAQNGWGTKLIDMMVHFQNKTNQPLGLGYVDGSGYALDERGNRYGLNAGAGGIRGMGVISGNNPNPQFTLSPGGGGDARFELGFNPGQAILGQTFEVGLEFREINSVGTGQYQLGNDTLVHYTGLANGAVMAPAGAMAGSPATNGQMPGQTAQGQPCTTGTTTGSNGVQQGTSTATNAISQVGSMLHGQSAGTTASNVAGAVPCMPAGASGLMNSVGSVAPALGSMGAAQNNGVYTAPGNYTNPGTYTAPGTYNSAPANYSTSPYGTVAPATTGTSAVQPIPTAKTSTPVPAVKTTAPAVSAQPVPAVKTATPIATTSTIAPSATAQPVPAAKVTQITPPAATPAKPAPAAVNKNAKPVKKN